VVQGEGDPEGGTRGEMTRQAVLGREKIREKKRQRRGVKSAKQLRVGPPTKEDWTGKGSPPRIGCFRKKKTKTEMGGGKKVTQKNKKRKGEEGNGLDGRIKSSNNRGGNVSPRLQVPKSKQTKFRGGGVISTMKKKKIWSQRLGDLI